MVYCPFHFVRFSEQSKYVIKAFFNAKAITNIGRAIRLSLNHFSLVEQLFVLNLVALNSELKILFN